MFIKKHLNISRSSHTKKISAAHFLSKAVVHWYLSEAVVRTLRNIEKHLEAATHLLKQKICSEAAAQDLTVFCTKYAHFVWRFFITFQWLWKHLWWLLNRKRYVSPSQCCYSISLNKPIVIVSIKGLLILCLLTVYTSCFLFSNNVCSLYIASPSNRQVL